MEEVYGDERRRVYLDVLKERRVGRSEGRCYKSGSVVKETMGSSSQIEEKTLRESVALLKVFSETDKVYNYLWMEGTKIVADVFTKEGSQRNNIATCEEGEIKIQNLTKKRNRKNG